MSVLMHDPGGIYYTTAQMTRRFTSVTNATVVAGAGANGRDVIRCANSQNFTLTLPAAETTLVIGARIRPLTIGSSTPLFTAIDAATVQWDCVLNTDGTISVRRNGTTVLGTSAASFSGNETAFLECKVVISDAAGTIEVRKNGVAIVGPTGSLDTKQTANTTANVIRWGVTGGANTVEYQDLYIDDANFIGDSRTEVLIPNANGDSSDFTGSDGNSTDNYLLVDDATADDDTTYVESDTTTNDDLYGVTNLSSSPETIFAVTVLPCWRKTAAGDVGGKTRLKSGTTTSDGAEVAVSDSYLFSQTIHEVDPDTSAAWTEAAVNAMQVGVLHFS